MTTFTRIYPGWQDDFCSIIRIGAAQYDLDPDHPYSSRVNYHTILTGVTGEPYNFQYRLQDPFLKVNREDMQKFFDELWTMGFRPSNYPKVERELKTLQDHLEDMQKMSFRLLALVEKAER